MISVHRLVSLPSILTIRAQKAATRKTQLHCNILAAQRLKSGVPERICSLTNTEPSQVLTRIHAVFYANHVVTPLFTSLS